MHVGSRNDLKMLKETRFVTSLMLVRVLFQIEIIMHSTSAGPPEEKVDETTDTEFVRNSDPKSAKDGARAPIHKTSAEGRTF